MQINNEFAPVMKSSGNMETSAASIVMSSHMFQILSAGIYEYPERACLRELSINGLDGQQMAGNVNTPLDVHLPTRLEPYFEVRDHGTGMTHDQVMKLYLTYGASTKRDSNDQVGGLGIGSKSPFAVAQSFTVTSYQDGIVRRYSVYMEEGIPQVTKLTESETTEGNGVAVRVAVPMDKITKFHEEAQRIYTHFPVKPNCNTTLVSMYANETILSQVPNEFTVFSGENRLSDYVDVSIVMGHIEYPIDIEDVMPNYSKEVPLYLRRNISKVLVYMPIGSVNIAASRESLQLNDRTRTEIARIFKKVSSEILLEFQKKIDAAPNLFEAVRAYNDAMASNRNRDHTIMSHLSYGGKTLHDWYLEQSTCRTHVVIDPKTGLPAHDYHGREKREFTYESIEYVTMRSLFNQSSKSLSTRDANSEGSFSIFDGMAPGKLEEVVFAVQDRRQKNGNIKTAGRKAVLMALCKSIYEKDHEERTVYLVKTEAEVKALAKLHHYPEDLLKIVKMSDFESAYVPAKVVRGQVKVWQGTKGGSAVEVKVSPDDFDEPQYYFKAEGNMIVTKDFHGINFDAMDFLKSVPAMLPTGQLFMFRKTVWSKIPEDWVEVDISLIEGVLKDNPEWWITFQRNKMREYSRRYNSLELSRMHLRLEINIAGFRTTSGYTHELKDRTPAPSMVNFEDNMDVIQGMFGRPQIVFAEDMYRERTCMIKLAARILPKFHAFNDKVKRAGKRIEKNVRNEILKSRAKNKLLSWVDWSKVTFREVAEELGYKVTPFVRK